MSKIKKDRYLINYYKNNNEVKERVYLKRKFLIKSIILLICSILFFLMITLSSFNKFQGDIEVLNSITIFRVVMYISLGLGICGIVFLIIYKYAPNTFERIYNCISFNKKRNLYSLLDWFTIFPVCIVVAIFLFSYIFIITPVSGDSMFPNIKNGEHVLVQYHKDLEFGKVVIVEVNEEDNIYFGETKYFIKRIIGMPGDQVTWENNVLTINGNVVNEEYFPENYFGQTNTNSFDGEFNYVDDEGNIQTTYVIPDGYYFVMGDNRAISNDSRDIGLIKEENIIGVATHHMKFILLDGEIK